MMGGKQATPKKRDDKDDTDKATPRDDMPEEEWASKER